MAKHWWYICSWMERDLMDCDPNLPVWLPRKVDVIASSKEECKYVLKSQYMDEGVPIIHLSIAKLGTQEDYLVNQGQLELDFKKVDPFSSV